VGKNFYIFFKNLVPKLFCFKFIYTVVFLWESVGKTQAHPDMRQNTRSNIIHVNGIPCSYQCDKSISGEECDNMKKIYKFGFVLVCVFIFVLFVDFKPTSIEYGTSELYSQQDMDSAIEIITNEFDSWDGCKLYSINYTDDNLCQRELKYCNTLAKEGVTYDECIVFRMQFRSPVFGGGAWNANFRYDWSWYLARIEGGEWELLTWGAP
jgi:D-alanyl-D-alanine carboxypeptidase